MSTQQNKTSNFITEAGKTAQNRSPRRAAVAVSAIIAVLLAASVLSIYIMSSRSENTRCAYIYQNGQLIKTVDLTTVSAPYTFTVTGSDGCSNTIEVRNGSIGITDASCPDKLCVRMGFISSAALPITCLPNHIVIELSHDAPGADNPDNTVDGIVY